MDNEGVAQLLFLTTMIATSGAVGFAIAWVRARDRARHAEERLAERALPGGASTERVEQALETMAQELERLSEGQRFTTELLAGRSEAARPQPLPPPRGEGSR